jgi:hypothetical protein
LEVFLYLLYPTKLFLFHLLSPLIFDTDARLPEKLTT